MMHICRRYTYVHEDEEMNVGFYAYLTYAYFMHVMHAYVMHTYLLVQHT